MIGIPLGLLAANGVEWVMHKQVLHGWGRKRGTFWAFHFHEHHRLVRANDFYDPNYTRFPLGPHAQGKEAWALIAGAVVATPMMPVAPLFVGTLWYSAGNYYYKHKKAHMNPDWGRKHLQWHYDHHMGRNPNANWCVTKPWFDYIMGTRIFTEGEAHESNVLGLEKLPRWIAKRLPDPKSLAKVLPAPPPNLHAAKRGRTAQAA